MVRNLGCTVVWGHACPHPRAHCKCHSIDGDNDNLSTNQRHQHSSESRTIGPQAKRSKLYKNFQNHKCFEGTLPYNPSAVQAV